MMKERTIIYISDGTAITTQSLGNSLLSQFSTIKFTSKVYPYVDSIEKAQSTLTEIEAEYADTNPIIFSTLVDKTVRTIFIQSTYTCFDLFDLYLDEISKSLDEPISPAVHKMHSMSDPDRYAHRIEAINFSLNCDDGLGLKLYSGAEVILIGVSRSGKTPTSLYMSLNFGILAANYPFTEEDFTDHTLPNPLKNHKDKLFGLIITAERLCQIRSARRANSQYALLEQCNKEIKYMEDLYKKYNIPYLDTTHRSIEEISTIIITEMNLKRL